MPSYRFAYRKPSPEALDMIRKLREAYTTIEATLQEVANMWFPDTAAPGIDKRCHALALTALEESAMWAIKGVVSNDPRATIQD